MLGKFKVNFRSSPDVGQALMSIGYGFSSSGQYGCVPPSNYI